MTIHNARLITWGFYNCIRDDYAAYMRTGKFAQVDPCWVVLQGKPNTEKLDKCQEAILEGAGIHIHVAEHEAEQCLSLEKWNQRVVDWLEKHGILGEGTTAAHVDPREINLLARRRIWVTYQQRTYMNNGAGMSPSESRKCAGLRLSLGMDGFSNALCEKWKPAYFVDKRRNRDPSLMAWCAITNRAVTDDAALANQIIPNSGNGSYQPNEDISGSERKG